MTMPGRKYSQPSSSYRYGFNGKEMDNSTGEGNLDFGARIMDVRLGRFLSVDPAYSAYPYFSCYLYAANCPIRLIDVFGNGPGDPPIGYVFGQNLTQSKSFHWKIMNSYGDYGYIVNKPLNAGENLYYVVDAENVAYWVVEVQLASQGNGFRIPYSDWYYFSKPPGNDKDAYKGGEWKNFKTQGQIDNESMIDLCNKTSTVFACGVASAFAAPALLEAGVSSTIATTLEEGLANSRGQDLSLGANFIKEASKKVIAARGDLTKVDWFDVVSSTISSKLGFGILGKSITEIANAGFDININDDGIKVTSVLGVVGDEKSNGTVFIDLTFGAFKLGVGEVAKGVNGVRVSSLPSEEAMKMMFDQAKTQLKAAIK
jgi:RHS repeat-associated protein